jgi:murein tripeptide amidase MpaA
LELPTTPLSYDHLTIEFQCAGAEYDRFATNLRAFAENTTLHTETWGRRAFPLPAHKSVLFLGNSHTRQTAKALVCQFADQVVTYSHKKRKKSLSSFHFTNNATLSIVINSPVEIAIDWVARLETLVKRPLDSWDLIVLGQFNGAGKELENTTYYRTMTNLSLQEPNDLQFGKVTPPGYLQSGRCL